MVRQNMKMDEPMSIGMMKNKMMKGDVPRSARIKEKEMEATMEMEERSMPSRGGGR